MPVEAHPPVEEGEDGAVAAFERGKPLREVVDGDHGVQGGVEERVEPLQMPTVKPAKGPSADFTQ